MGIAYREMPQSTAIETLRRVVLNIPQGNRAAVVVREP